MTHLELQDDGVMDAHTARLPHQAESRLLQALLLCGAASSLLYAATDVLGGIRYGGYSFASQAISELAAFGAPSKSLVDPLFRLYGVLALAFATGVVQSGARGGRAMRITGVMLIGYALTGLLAPASSAMHRRGTATVATDLPHLVLTGLIVVWLLLAIIAGAMALGRRFRIYSFVTLLTAIVFGAATIPYAERLGAGKPTTGLGVIERIDVYSMMLWLAVLSVALVRRRHDSEDVVVPLSDVESSRTIQV